MGRAQQGLAVVVALLGLAQAARGQDIAPTGQILTPTAAPGALFQPLNPDLPSNPAFTAGQASAVALSPDGRTLLILTSGFNEEDVLERFTGLDLAGFIQKPFKLEALVDLVCRVMAGEPEAPEEKTRVL